MKEERQKRHEAFIRDDTLPVNRETINTDLVEKRKLLEILKNAEKYGTYQKQES